LSAKEVHRRIISKLKGKSKTEIKCDFLTNDFKERMSLDAENSTGTERRFTKHQN